MMTGWSKTEVKDVEQNLQTLVGAGGGSLSSGLDSLNSDPRSSPAGGFHQLSFSHYIPAAISSNCRRSDAAISAYFELSIDLLLG